jgi:hypothetical protein
VSQSWISKRKRCAKDKYAEAVPRETVKKDMDSVLVASTAIKTQRGGDLTKPVHKECKVRNIMF